MSERERIAEELLGCSLSPGGFAPCPGIQHHTKGKGARDFRVILDGAPTGFCFHSSCADEVGAFNKELRRRIWAAEHGNAVGPHSQHVAKEWGVAPEPKAEKERPELDPAHVEEFIRGVPAISEDFLRRRSPVDVAKASPIDFLRALFGNGEKVLVFTDQRTQGDFIFWARPDGAEPSASPARTYRLAQQQGVKAVPSALPSGAPEGVWYLVQPVTGQWAINPNSVKAGGEAKWSRRSEGNVTDWRHFVLESDELAAEDWLRVVVNLRLPIAAIYTSGKRSIHALVRVKELASKAVWDSVRNAMRALVCPLGADPAALTAVRLSRLPGCKRGNNLQRLLYLDPDPEHEAIWLKPEVRA